MTLRWRDVVCLVFGCRRPKPGKYGYIYACSCCGRVDYVPAKGER